MRIVTVLCAPCLVAVLALSQVSSSPKQFSFEQREPSIAQNIPEVRGMDTVRMWRRAEIQVIPLDVVASNRSELQSLRDRQTQIEVDSIKLDITNQALREQIARQQQLIRALFAYADRQGTDYGKSPAAIDVQRHLNQIEGQMMCEACHTSFVAELPASRAN